MSMSVGAVSAVNFRGNEMLERPGKYANSTVQETSEPKKKSSAGKKALGFVATLAVIAAALVGLTKGNVVKTIAKDALKDASKLDKFKHYIATAGEFIAKYTYDPIAALIKGSNKAV